MNTNIVTLRDSLLRWSGKVAKFMEKRPVLGNSILCFHLWVAGDLLAQSYEHKNEPFNYSRTLQSASFGVFTGSLYAIWYPFLDRQCVAWNVASRFPTSAWTVPMAKVAADELLMDPPVISMFFAYMDFCQNNWTLDTERAKAKIVNELPRAWVTSLVAWPVVLLATFRFVPIYAQSAVVNACAIVWDGFLSHRNALANKQGAATATQLLSSEEGTEPPTLTPEKSSTRRLSVHVAPSVNQGSQEQTALRSPKEE